MGKTTFEALCEILRSVQENVDDPETDYKLRTARQLVVLLDEQHTMGRKALEEAEIDAETRDRLRKLGYLD